MKFRAVSALDRLCLAAVALAVPQAALAQSGGQSANDLKLPDTDRSAQESVDVRVERDGGMRAPCPFQNSPLKVSLSGVDFVDARGGALDPRLAATLARVQAPSGQQSLEVVCTIRDAANAALREDGWIAAVQVPQQDVAERLQLDVVSASFSEVRIVGDAGPFRDALGRVLAPLKDLSPLNERDAERILLLANDIPGLNVRLAIAPSGEAPGLVIGNLAVDFERYAATLNVRNYNARSIGRETGFARFDVRGLTGLSDITYVAGQATADFQEQYIVQGGHEMGLSGNNLRLGGSLTYAVARPDLQQNLDLETTTLLANLQATYPLMRTVASSANLSLGFDYIDQDTDVGTSQLTSDSLRTLYLRGTIDGRFTRLDRSTSVIYSAFAEMRKGLEFLGATERVGRFSQTDGVSASRPFGKADALVLRGGVDATWFLNSTFDLRVRAEGQWANDPLLNFDEYSIGNLSIGRGYDPGANSGDRAIGGSAEIGAALFQNEEHRVQAFGFYDVIQIENLDQGTPDPVRTLESVGGGLRWFFKQGLSAEVTYAKPLDRALFQDNKRPPERVLLSLTTRFPALFR